MSKEQSRSRSRSRSRSHQARSRSRSHLSRSRSRSRTVSPSSPYDEEQEERLLIEAQREQIRRQNVAKNIRITFRNKNVKTPPTVLANDKGILYFEGREATGDDPEEGIYTNNPDGTGPTYYKNGQRRVKPLPLLDFASR